MSFMPRTAWRVSLLILFPGKGEERREKGKTGTLTTLLPSPFSLPVLPFPLHVFFSYILINDDSEFRSNVFTAQGHGLFAIDVDRRSRALTGTGQADADVRQLAFARSVHHTAHHRHGHALNAFMALAPHRHLLAQMRLDALRQLLKETAGGASASGTGRHHRRERPQAHGLQNLLRDQHFPGAVTARYTAIRSCTSLTLHDSTMRLCAMPSCSARCALSSAEAISAARVTSPASLGCAQREVSSIMRTTRL